MQSPRRAFLGHLGLSLVGLLARMGLGRSRMPQERSVGYGPCKFTSGPGLKIVEGPGSLIEVSKIPDGKLRQLIARSPTTGYTEPPKVMFSQANGGIVADHGMHIEDAKRYWNNVRFVGFERPLIPAHRKLQ